MQTNNLLKDINSEKLSKVLIYPILLTIRQSLIHIINAQRKHFGSSETGLKMGFVYICLMLLNFDFAFKLSDKNFLQFNA